MAVNLLTEEAFDEILASMESLKTQMETWLALAEDWAENPEDVEVVTGQYSALHHALKAASDRVAAEQAKTDAETALAGVQQIFDDFDDRYLGPYANDPATDNDGDPLSPGLIYWNTTAQELRFYNGTGWEAPDAQAAQSAANALASEQKAADWAEEDEDVEVETGQYSAKHHALKSLASATAALQHKDKAQKWAEEDVDVEVEPGLFSAKHWAKKAEGNQLLNIVKKTEFTATADQTVFAFPHDTDNDLLVFANTGLLSDSDFSSNGTNVTLNSARSAGDVIVIIEVSDTSGGTYDDALDAYNNVGKIVAYDSFHDLPDEDPRATTKSGHTCIPIGNGLKVVDGNLVATASGDGFYVPVTGSFKSRLWSTANGPSVHDYGLCIAKDSNNIVAFVWEYGYRMRIIKVINGAWNLVTTLQDVQIFGGSSYGLDDVPIWMEINVDTTLQGVVVNTEFAREGSDDYDYTLDADVQDIINNMAGVGIFVRASTAPLFHSWTIMKK